MGDAVITIDADLQDDLKAIEEMVDRYNEGYDIVYGVKISRDADSFMKRNTALVFYKLQRSLGVKAIHNHAGFGNGWYYFFFHQTYFINFRSRIFLPVYQYCHDRVYLAVLLGTCYGSRMDFYDAVFVVYR